MLRLINRPSKKYPCTGNVRSTRHAEKRQTNICFGPHKIKGGRGKRERNLVAPFFWSSTQGNDKKPLKFISRQSPSRYTVQSVWRFPARTPGSVVREAHKEGLLGKVRPGHAAVGTSESRMPSVRALSGLRAAQTTFNKGAP